MRRRVGIRRCTRKFEPPPQGCTAEFTVVARLHSSAQTLIRQGREKTARREAVTVPQYSSRRKFDFVFTLETYCN
jgi:hypothetical protein